MFIMCTHIAWYRIKLIQPTYQTHTVFSMQSLKKAGFQLGTMPGIILGSGPIGKPLEFLPDH